MAKHFDQEDLKKETRKSGKANKNNSNTNKKVKKKKHKGLRIALLVILALLIIFAGIFGYRVYKNGGGLSGFLAAAAGHDENTKKTLSEIQFLLIGESGNMTDTIMACSYNPNTQKASMLSVPRDTFIGDNAKHSTASDKINSVYNRSKDPMDTVKEVNELTGLNLQYYVFVDTNALIELVDAIGGVDFYVPTTMNYDDTSKENYIRIHLNEGMQKINGEQAEGLLRFRHNNDGTTYPDSYGGEDIGRMRTQREFIMATLKQTLKPENVFKIGQILEIANKNVKTNIPMNLIKDYVPYAVEFNTENITTAVLPGEPTRPGPVWIYLADDDEMQVMISNLFFGGTYDPEAKDKIDETGQPVAPTVQVLNGSGNPENLKPVIDKLKENGFDVIKVGNTSSTKKSTIINRTKQSTETAEKIESILGIEKVSTGKDNVDADFTVTIGKDYE